MFFFLQKFFKSNYVCDQVKVEVPMPKSVLNCSLVASQGKYSFDPVTKVLMWDVGEFFLLV